MKFFKRLNLLDYIVLFGVILTVLFAGYNFLPQKSKECKMTVFYEGEAKIKDGDICFDMDGNKTLGEIRLTEKGFSVSFGGRYSENGIRLGEKVYAINLPVKMIVGDYYLEGKIEEIDFGD